MSRSSFKKPFISSTKEAKIQESNKPIQIKNKSLIITPFDINVPVKIYNGKKYIILKFTSEAISYKFGEFINTRARFQFKKK